MIDELCERVEMGQERVPEEILRFTRRMRVVLKPIAFNTLAEETIAEARLVVGSGVQLQVAIQDQLCILGDSSHLQQTFLNLCANARDAMEGKGTIRFEARRATGTGVYSFGVIEGVEQFGHITVADTGAGMSNEVRRRIFEPLFTTKQSGTGLGLALVHQIITNHGGQIFVESEEGQGTSFHIFLPLSTSPVVTTQRPLSRDLPHIRRLVLVEDDEHVAFGLSAILQLEGIEVNIAGTGAAAVDLIARTSPDVVLLDVGLPDMTGFDVYKNIAQRWPLMPITFSTGHADVSELGALAAEPHIKYLLKPYDIADLLQVLKSLEPQREVGLSSSSTRHDPRSSGPRE